MRDSFVNDVTVSAVSRYVCHYLMGM